MSLVACSGQEGWPDGGEPICELGESQPCVCAGGLQGDQECRTDRSGWTPCECGEADGDSDVDSDIDADADSDADVDGDSDTDADEVRDVDVDDDVEIDCEPDCDGRHCGPDGCGGQCGECSDGESCTPDGRCEAPCDELRGEGEPLAERSECGTLWYGLYANRGSGDNVHRLPNFSFAGYRRGGVAIPEVEVVERVEPGPGDDRERIQEAIDRVASRAPNDEGRRGAVLLAAGTYEVGNSLRIEASGVVLRGAGQGEDGTVLVATRREQHDLIEVEGGGRGLGELDDTRTRITSPLVPVGSRSFDVASTEGFSVGDVVGVLRTPNRRWIEELGMDTWGWTADSYTVAHERRVVAIEGNTVTVDIPLVDTMEDRYGGGSLFRADLTRRIEEVGVEDLRLVSEYRGSTDEDHGWRAVILRRVTNSWVRRVTAVHFGYAAVSLNEQSSFNTVEECAMLEPVSEVTGGRRYSFNLTSGTGNLFQRCYSEEARHDFVSGARTTGPNVWLDCFSQDSTTDDGPHHRWATGLLFDNLASLYLHVENREDSGSGHGWSGAQTLFWNGVARGVRCDAPLGAMNWTIGSMGEQQEGQWAPGEPFGWWESHGTPVEPRSLYLQQLGDRLGPEAVRAVTTSDQREGRIWGRLAAWAGEGRLDGAAHTRGDPECSTGLGAGLACCEAACGSCGGTGCGSRPGGAESCCSGRISTSGRSCHAFAPPCILDPTFETIGEGP